MAELQEAEHLDVSDVQVDGEVPGVEIPGVTALTAVIVHRMQPQACVRTGRELTNQAEQAGMTMNLVVVDNGSSIDALELLRAGLPHAELIELGANTGFGPGANAGLRHFLDGDPSVMGEWVLVCPHDASPERHCLQRLVTEAAMHSGAGLASAEYGETSSKVKPMVHRYCGSYLVASEQIPGWEDSGYPHGTMMVAKRECLDDIGLFDERYFAYCEEADLGERARRAGWKVGVIWGAVVRNPTMSSEVGVPEYLMVRNTLILVRNYFGLSRVTVLLLLTAWITLAGAILPSKQTPYWHLRARLLAMRDFLLGRTGPPPQSLLALPMRD